MLHKIYNLFSVEYKNCFFYRKKLNQLMILLLLIIITIGFSHISNFQIRRFTDGNEQIGFFVKRYFPPKFNDLSRSIRELWLTIAISIGSTVLAAFFALFATFFTSKSLSLNEHIGRFFMNLASICRNVPVYIWQLLLGMIFYTGGFFLAFFIIFLTALGFLIRSFGEVVDNTSTSSIEALQTVGANKVSIMINGILPDTISQLVSWTLFSIETNIRSSSLIGYLTGSGIGFLVSYYRGFKRDFQSTLAIIIIIQVTLIVWDLLSNKLRGLILNEN